MPITDNVKNEMRFEFECGTDRTHDVITKTVELHEDEDDLPHLTNAFVGWMVSVGFAPEILIMFLLTACISHSEDVDMCMDNTVETLSGLEKAFSQIDGDGHEKSESSSVHHLHEYLEQAHKKANPVSKVMSYEQFVDEFQQEDSFRKYMYNVYVGDMTE